MRYWLVLIVGACIAAGALLVLSVVGAWLDGRYRRHPGRPPE